MQDHPRHPLSPGRAASRGTPGDRDTGHPVLLRLATAALALIVAASGAPVAARAAEGLYLTWNDCYLGPTQASNLDFACNTNSGQNELYCAFTMPEAADNVIAIEVTVDLQHSISSLPLWWRLLGMGECRDGDIAAAADFPGRTACTNMWEGATTLAAMVQDFVPTEPRGADSQARIKVTAFVPQTEPVTVDGTSTYYAVRVILKNEKTVGDPFCAGCQEAACLVLNSILIGRSVGANYFLQTPGANGSNWALWQGGAGADCAAVPVRKRAWGQVKGLYR